MSPGPVSAFRRISICFQFMPGQASGAITSKRLIYPEGILLFAGESRLWGGIKPGEEAD